MNQLVLRPASAPYANRCFISDQLQSGPVNGRITAAEVHQVPSQRSLVSPCRTPVCVLQDCSVM